MRAPSADGNMTQIASDPQAFEVFYRRHVDGGIEGWTFQEGAAPGDKS